MGTREARRPSLARARLAARREFGEASRDFVKSMGEGRRSLTDPTSYRE